MHDILTYLLRSNFLLARDFPPGRGVSCFKADFVGREFVAASFLLYFGFTSALFECGDLLLLLCAYSQGSPTNERGDKGRQARLTTQVSPFKVNECLSLPKQNQPPRSLFALVLV